MRNIRLAISLALTCTFLLIACKKTPAIVVITEKSKQLFGAAWVYDTEATRRTVMQKAHDSLGGGIKNIKDIRLEGDVKKMADAFAAQTLVFAADKQGRGIGFLLTEGKGLLAQKTEGWATWNTDETVLTLTPTNSKRKPLVYTVKDIKPNRLEMLPEGTATETPEIFTR